MTQFNVEGRLQRLCKKSIGAGTGHPCAWPEIGSELAAMPRWG